MSTSNTKQPSKFQTKLDSGAAGLTSTSLSLLNSLVILGVAMSRADIITKLKSYSSLFTAVSNARQSYAAAVAARVAAMAQMQTFYLAFVVALKAALGPTNQGLLPGFGVSLPKARKDASPETKAIAKVKSAATREARGTMGKKQRGGITATPGMTFQVLDPNGQPVTSAAPSTSSSTPPSSAPTPSGAGSKPMP
jgi:hypothetical protein